ncbi:MAG: hypothetical protein IKZ21_05540 [Clostridia bacterium]|nr:hypothetical protein [Clostridia bacterium]
MELLKLEELTAEQKIGMVLCARRFRADDMEFVLELVRKKALGAIQAPFQTPEVARKVKEAADYPILIVNDTEMGYPTSNLPKIPLIALAATGKKEYYRAFAKAVVRDAQADNCNGTWGPVVDILHNDGPCKVHRCLSDRPEKVAEIAEEIARVYNQNHYFSCGKHYPGGAKSGRGEGTDSHMTGNSLEISEEELVKINFGPYLHLWEKGLLPSIMVGHGTYVDIDPQYPASLSKKMIGIIRNMGYDGVFFTDSFAMLAILQEFGEENIYGMAIAAGNDIVLPNYLTPVKDCYEMLLQNFKDGMFTEERLDEAVRRVLDLQAFVGAAPEEPTVFTPEDELLLRDVARDCITAVCDDGVEPALEESDKKRLFIILTENDFNADEINPEVTIGRWYDPTAIATKVRELFPGARMEYLKEFSSAGDNDRVLRAATGVEEVVFVTFCTTAPYLGTDCLTRRTESVINALAISGKLKAVVHFGNPYALKTLYHVPRKIFGYMIPDSQKFAMDVLAGKLEAKGTLPFEITYP